MTEKDMIDIAFICNEAISIHGVGAKVRIPIRSPITPTASFVDMPKFREGFAAFILCDILMPLVEYEAKLENRLEQEKTTNIHWERIVREHCISQRPPGFTGFR